jgi:hypothetical protein
MLANNRPGEHRPVYNAVLVTGDHGRIPQYFAGDHSFATTPTAPMESQPSCNCCIRPLNKEFSKSMRSGWSQDKGDFVLVAAKGSLAGYSCVYCDLYRVEGADFMPKEVKPVL